YPSSSNYTDIIFNNETNAPCVGSMVEFSNFKGDISFGVVVSPSQSKFNESFNKISILTIDNEIVTVSPQQCNLHFHKVLNSEWLDSLAIIESSDCTDPSRLQVVTILNHFLNSTLEVTKSIESQMDIVHSQFALPHTLASISAVEIIESMKLPASLLAQINQSYFHEVVLLAAIHFVIAKSLKWILPPNNSMYRNSNLIYGSYSNCLVPSTTYLVNSISNTYSLTKFIDYSKDPAVLENMNGFLNNLYDDQTSHKARSYEDLNHYINIWEGSHHKHVIDVLKFFVVYPHPTLKKILKQFDLFSKLSPAPESVYKVLEEIGIYNNSRNQLSDIHLSTSMFGRNKLSALATSTITELEPLVNSDFLHGTKMSDKFPHLRESNLFYQDQVIYALPSLKASNKKSADSFLAISLEKLNSRKYVINVHIPDIITKIAPNSNLFNSLATNSTSMCSMSRMVDGTSANELFSPKIIEEFKFKNQNLNDKSADMFQVGDIAIKKSSNSKLTSDSTCITISYTYNTYEGNPFANIPEKISVSFDSLSSVTIKNLGWQDLEDSLNGKSEVSPFRLFRSRSKKDTYNGNDRLLVTNEDSHNLNFVYSVMRTHFKIRNLAGSSQINPAVENDVEDASSLTKELNIINSNRPEEKHYEKSRFFMAELELFAANLTSNYCEYNDIPVLTVRQELMDEDGDNADTSKRQSHPDNAIVSHDNKLLPSYEANSYFQTLLARDENGFVSSSAAIIGRNFLNKSIVEVFSGDSSRNVAKGLSKGYVDIINVTNNFGSMLNQMQLLSHIQLGQTNAAMRANGNHFHSMEKFSYLKRYGYYLNGPLSPQTLEAQLNKLVNAETTKRYLTTRHKMFWTLKFLEQKLLESSSIELGSNNTEYECIVTDVGIGIDDIGCHLSKAFCQELGIELNVLTPDPVSYTVGSVVYCNKVIYLDVPGGVCVLLSEQDF
ncbi:predicted protein, partial [Scheffersomyces stipitis CBS 6054]